MFISAPSESEYRHALGQFATGVTVVTTLDAQGRAVGVTANSFSSVSLDPPLILWSLSMVSSNVATFCNCRHFRVHVLTAAQIPLARLFATRGVDKFAHGAWRVAANGMPALDGCAAWFDCESRSQYDEGDHVILVGRVNAFEVCGGHALIFHGGKYLSTGVVQPSANVLRPCSAD